MQISKGGSGVVNKRILITGGSHAELPIIQAAKNRGDYVITTGNDKQGLGHKAADEYVPCDYSDKERIYQLAKELQVDAIVSGCNDFAYLSTAYACEKLGLKGHDNYQTAMVIHHKNEFRMCTSSLGIRTPKAKTCNTLDEAVFFCHQIDFPVLVKPIDLTGGKGVLICNTEEEVKKAFLYARDLTRESVVLVEEYIQGTNHGASVLLKNQKVIFGFVDNEQYYKNPYLVSGACFPSDVPQCTILKLFHDIETIAEKLKLVDGLFHTQFIVEEDYEPVMIDPCRRAPGDLYILLVKYATEIDYPAEILKAECGETVSSQYKPVFHNVARECIMTNKNGIVNGIQIDSALKNKLIDEYIWSNEGDSIEDYLKYKAGILFFSGNDYRELYNDVEQFHELVTIQVQGE